VKYLSVCSEEFVRTECSAGRNFPVPPDLMKSQAPELATEFPNGCFVKAPSSRIGRELNLTKLAREFGAALDKVFPPGK